MSTQNAINQGDSTRIFSGIETWGGSGSYFDDTTLGSFTLLRGGIGYVKGRPVSWTAPQTVTGLTAGNLYWLYIDITGTLQKTSTFSFTTFTDNIPLFECLRDSTSPTNNQYTVREDHPYYVEGNTSIYLHNVIGPVIRNSNNGANITLNGTQKIQINGQDYLEDHGLTTTIPDSSGVGVTWRKVFTDGSGKWCTYSNTDTFLGNYNNAGTVTALGGSKFGVYTLYVSKDNITSSTPTYYAVLDTSQYNNITAANTAISNGTTAKATNELYNLELAQLGYIVYSQASSSIVQVTISKSTLKATLSTGGTNTAALVNTSTANFDGILSAANTNVQSSLETIDEWGKTTTDHALLIGNGTGSAIGSLSIGTTGQVLQGVTSNDPSWSTATYPSTVAIGDVLIASAANVIGATTGAATAGYVLTANGAGAAPTFQAASSGGVNTFHTDGSDATGSAGAITIAGTANKISTSGSGATVTITVPSSPSFDGTTTSATGFTATAGGLTISNAAGNIAFTNTQTAALLTLAGESYLSSANDVYSVYLGYKCGPASKWSGSYNHIFGAEAAQNLTNAGGGYEGDYNMCFGQQALCNGTSARFNIVFGKACLYNLTSGYFNTVFSNYSAYRMTTGAYNLILGMGSTNITSYLYYGAGYNYTSSESSNVCLQANGTAGESNVLRIGDATGTGIAELNKAYICGIYGKTGGASPQYVIVGSDNQLGSTSTVAGSFTWTPDATTTITATAGNGYVLTNGTSSTVTVTLPASPSVGDRISVLRMLAGITNIAQGSSGQIIYISSTPTTSGTGHGVTAASATSFRKMELLCYTTNKWVAIDMAGSWTTY